MESIGLLNFVVATLHYLLRGHVRGEHKECPECDRGPDDDCVPGNIECVVRQAEDVPDSCGRGRRKDGDVEIVNSGS